MGHVEIARYLLIFGADVNHRDASKNTALHHAIVNKYTKLVVLLLANFATSYDDFPL